MTDFKTIVSQELSKISSIITSKDAEIIIEGKHIRLYTEYRGMLELQELPVKGKKKLDRFWIKLWLAGVNFSGSTLNMENLIRYAKISKSDSYKKSMKKLIDASNKLFEETKENHPEKIKDDYKNYFQNGEEKVFYLEVEPVDYKPLTIKGKDFVVKTEWGKFESYSPSSDLQQHDPSYTIIESKSKVASRKFFKMAKANPDMLKGIKWNDFDKWLDSKKIHWDMHFSVWH